MQVVFLRFQESIREGESTLIGKKNKQKNPNKTKQKNSTMFSQGFCNNQLAFSAHWLIWGIISQWRIRAGNYEQQPDESTQ